MIWRARTQIILDARWKNGRVLSGRYRKSRTHNGDIVNADPDQQDESQEAKIEA